MGASSAPRLEALLNAHSFFSFGRGVSSPSALAGTAAELGYKYVALVDELNVGGAVELHGAAQTLGLTPIVGATLPLRLEETVYPVVIIAASRAGYVNLNDLITRVLYDGEEAIELDALLGRTADLFLLTGGRSGFPSQLLAGRQLMVLERLIGKLKESFKNRLFIQLYFDHHPGDARRTRILRKLGMDVGVPVVAAPQVRYARKEDYPLYDALVCARLGITVDTPHPERPQTRAACVPDPEGITKRFPFPEALSNAAALANEASFALLPERLLPPLVRVPDGWTPEEFLRQQCYSALPHRYSVTKRDEAASKLEEELSIIAKLELAEFFLAAAEVMDFCHSRGILAAGRGSAAASITCYLLGITRADPLEHGLLFERFLHGGKTAMPDVDIDISSRRRQEVLDWVEERFGGEGAACEAMVANRITYRLRSAIQDVGRALGVPPEVRNKLSHALGRDYGNLRPHRAKEAEARFSEVLGNAPVKKAMLELLASIEPGLTRHFAPHSGGTVLSRYPLSHYSPQFKSKNGMRVLQFDKDDAEQLGLIKLDLLGLRMLGALELAREEVYRLEGLWLDFTALPDDPEVWRMIDVGETLTLFQIESPGQTKLSVDLKPKTLTELAHQIAIHRPGPIQSGTVRPYLERHKGREPVRYAHPVLEAILGKTYGVVLFQEDVLRLAVNFAGMSWADGDRFRKAVSKAEDAETIDEEREAFVAGAHRHVSATREQAEEVFAMIQGFRGYGFAQSHAFAFAQHAYASAWLKYHYPAEWLSAVLNELPGMWPLSTLRQDAKTWGVSFFKLDINASGVMWRVERNDDGSKGVRVPLTAVEGVSEDTARSIVMNRLEEGVFRGLEDFYERLALDITSVEKLTLAGAFDGFTGRRQVLYRLHALRNTQPPAVRPLFRALPKTPVLKPLHLRERYGWDLQVKGFSELGVHPLDLIRSQLAELGVTPLSQVAKRRGAVKTAGLIVARQKPPTAGGAAFYVIEDGPVRLQVQISPELWAAYNLLLRDARLLIVLGEVHKQERFLAIRAQLLWHLPVEVDVRGYHFS